jgi:5-methylthioribose kinase
MDYTSLKSRFHTIYPEKFFLDYSINEVNVYLTGRRWLKKNEFVTGLEKPGEGNMNLVIRVLTNLRSFILKQARPWAEKYPHIPAPVERNHVEAVYFLSVSADKVLRSYSPEVLGYDEENFIIMFNDLGRSVDFSSVYTAGNYLEPAEKESLLEYLSALHHFDCPEFPYNGSMRKLNHEYIFIIPFMENNGLDLDAIQEGLKKTSLPYTKNERLKKDLVRLGNYYLEEGPVLIHGDYFPGSWLKSDSGIKIIDPEFGFKGYGEFDLGVMIAHMTMGQQGMAVVEELMNSYEPNGKLNRQLLAGYAGTEILRRLIGVAQLPLSLTIDEKINLMETAERWILTGKIEPI